MASEAIIERMIVELVGDSRSYKKMLEDARHMTSTYTTRIGSLWRNAAGQMITSQKKMQAAMLESQHAAMRLAGNMQILGQEVARAGKSLSMYVTAPLVAMGGAAIKFGSDFESGFAGVRRTVEATETQFAKLNKEFRELAATIPVSAEELLRIGEIAGQLGIKNENIIGFTRTIAELTATSNLSIEEGAESMARFSNIVQMSEDKFHNLGSAIVSLGVSMAASESDITEMSMRIAAAGKLVGLTIPEILSLAASLSSIGIKAEMGGSAISRMMLQISKGVATGAEEIDRFAQISGMSTEKFKESWRTNVGQTILTFLSGLEALDSEIAALAMEELSLDGIRLHQTVLGASHAVNLFAGAMDRASKAFEANLALTEMSEERFKTFGSTVIIVYNQMKLLLTEVFEVMRPHLVAVIKLVETLTKHFRGWSDEAKKTVIIIGAAAAAIGPFLVIAGSLIASIGQLKLAFIFMKTALPALFVIPGVGQIAAVIAVVVLLFANWEKATDALSGVFRPFKELLNSLGDLFGELKTTVGPLLKLLGPVFVEAIKGTVFVLNTMIYMLKELTDFIVHAINKTEELILKLRGVPNPNVPRSGKIDMAKEVAKIKMEAATGTPKTPDVKAPRVSPIAGPTDAEKEWGKEFNKAFDRIEDMKSKFDDELAQLNMSERDYLISQLNQEADKGVFQDKLQGVLDAYDKLQKVKKEAAEVEKETKLQDTIKGELEALKDQRRELELGERAFLAFDLARKGASKTQIMAALATYDQVDALEALAEKEEKAEEMAKKAAAAQKKFNDSIQMTVEATGRGFSATIAREEARMKRPTEAKNVTTEKEKQKAENQKQGMLAEKAVAQGMKIYQVLQAIKDLTAAGNQGPVIGPANIGT